MSALLALLPDGSIGASIPRPAAVVGPPVLVEFAVGNEPSFEVSGMLSPTERSEWLTIGTYRSAPGAINQLVVYSGSPGRDWVMVANSGESGPDVEVAGVVSLADGSAVVFGAIDTDDDRRPATWLFDGTTLHPAATVGDEATPGRISAGSVAPDGTWYVVVERRDKDGEVWAEVNVRPPGAAWATTRLPTGGTHLRARGVAALGNTVVVTGDARDPIQRSPTYEAAAYVSDDGGRTFMAVDTRAMTGSGPTALGPVVAHTDGTFYAASCTGRGFSYATSVDGHVWEVHPDPDRTLPGGGCLAISVDDAGGVWLVRYLGHLVAIRMVDDIPTEGVIVPADERVFFTAQYLGQDRYVLAVSPTHVGLVGAQHGGVRGGMAERVGDVSYVDPALGIPSGHPAFRSFTVVDDAGSLVQIDGFPVPVAYAEGGWMETVSSELRELQPGGTLAPSAEPLPTGPTPAETTELVIELPTGQVAFGSLNPTDPNERTGSIGDLGISRRATGEPWPPLKPALTGEGAPMVGAAAAAGSTVIAVGGEARGSRISPLVGLDDGTAFHRLDEPIVALSAPLSGVCRLPDGQYLVVGGRVDDRPLALLLDVAAETLATSEAAVDRAVTAFTDCATAADGVVVVGETTGGPSLFVTTDGITFAPVAALGPTTVAVSVDAGVAGIAVTGRRGATGGAGFVAFGSTVADLTVLDAPTMEGPGVHEPMQVVVRQTEVLVLGAINDAPVVWPVSLAVG